VASGRVAGDLDVEMQHGFANAELRVQRDRGIVAVVKTRQGLIDTSATPRRSGLLRAASKARPRSRRHSGRSPARLTNERTGAQPRQQARTLPMAAQGAKSDR
jgi:hypothetical protein